MSQHQEDKDPSTTKKNSIVWDDDEDFEFEKDERSSSDFEQILADKEEKEDEEGPVSLRIGEKIKGVIASKPATIGDVMIDIGGKRSAIIEGAELFGEDGETKYKLGDAIDVFIVAKKDEILLSFKMSQSLRSVEDLEAAQARKLPVRGRVVKQIKGGFEVAILGKSAFCPISQIDTRFVENGEDYVGKEFEFLVEKVESRGRNIVVSRSQLLKAQAEIKAKELLTSLTPETVLDGVVKELRDFGAFVDIGGLDGLVHISEISHARVAKPADVLTVGDKVRVKVLKIDRDDKGRPKISLSLKAAQTDPWDQVHSEVHVGQSFQGRVTNLMNFGAFVELKAGLEGLVHVSEMSWVKRVHHPSDVVKVGDVVSVVVRDIDASKRRISLSMKQVEQDPWFDAAQKFPVGKTFKATVERLKTFGAILQLAEGVTGLVPVSMLKRSFGEAYRQACTPGKELEVKILNIDLTERKIQLGLSGIEEDGDADADYREYLKAAEKERQEAARDLSLSEQGKSEATTQRVGSFGALLGAKLGRK